MERYSILARGTVYWVRYGILGRGTVYWLEVRYTGSILETCRAVMLSASLRQSERTETARRWRSLHSYTHNRLSNGVSE